MNVICTACNSRYSIADSLIPPQGARFKCRRCSAVIAIAAPVMELAPTELEVIPPPAPSPAPRAPAPPPPALERPAVPAYEEVAPPPLVTERPTPAAEMPPPEPGFQQGFYSEPPPPTPPREPAVESAPEPAISHAPEPPAYEPAITRAPETSFGQLDAPASESPRSSFSGGAPPMAASEPELPAIFDAPRPQPQPTQTPTATTAPPTPSAPAPAASTIPPQGGTPIPEGLSPEERAKHEKARRLARVLASDIAIYNRDKRERGIKDGNLVAVLGYEIKKSWEIYKERVTPEFANATPYFRDALNEMLAEGKKIF
jgi:predicted Zn finger-like uncharacterized protein